MDEPDGTETILACFVCKCPTDHISRETESVSYLMCSRCLILSENHRWLIETNWNEAGNQIPLFGEGCWIHLDDAHKLFGNNADDEPIIFMPLPLWQKFKKDNAEYDFSRDPDPTAN